MEQYHGMTAEMYKAVAALVDDRMRGIMVTRQDFDRLAEAQAGTEERLSQLAEAQAGTEERLSQLAEAQARTEERLEATVEKLAEAQARTGEQLQDLVQVMAGMQTTLGAVKGRQLELTYQQKAGAYFGPLLRRLRVLSPFEMEDDLEAHLSTEEFEDLLRLDLLVSGRPRHMADAPQVWLATEVSTVVGRHDVERARQRAAALRRAGYRAIPTVAGERATAGAEKEARLHKTLPLQDGRALFWEEALEEALTL
jgi:hypothetical protein